MNSNLDNAATETMGNELDGMRPSRLTRFNRWSKQFPNARLGVCGLMLFGLAVATVAIGGWIRRPVFDGRVYRYPTDDDSILFMAFGVTVEIATFAGLVIVVFAIYRGIRDSVRGKRQRK